MSNLDTSAVAYQIILTKADKLTTAELSSILSQTLPELKRHPAAHPRVLVTSSEKGTGLDLLRAEIALLT